mmetsp:Transcript_124275/g.362846  ORF Transcript_124275/g.362846 Transcript_124275/m.362846 type:complete len:251 (-) Transcript_124275:274-1026(-)
MIACSDSTGWELAKPAAIRQAENSSRKGFRNCAEASTTSPPGTTTRLRIASSASQLSLFSYRQSQTITMSKALAGNEGCLASWSHSPAAAVHCPWRPSSARGSCNSFGSSSLLCAAGAVRFCRFASLAATLAARRSRAPGRRGASWSSWSSWGGASAAGAPSSSSGSAPAERRRAVPRPFRLGLAGATPEEPRVPEAAVPSSPAPCSKPLAVMFSFSKGTRASTSVIMAAAPSIASANPQTPAPAPSSKT